jgi:hypothetical protein
MGIELTAAVHRIDRGDDRIEADKMAHQRIVEQQLHDGSGVGEAGGFHEHALEGGDFTAVAPRQQAAQGIGEIAAHGAAQAAAGHHRDLAAHRLIQQMIERDLAKFIDDDGAVGHAGMAQQLVDQSGLAAAEEAGDQRDGQALR